VDIVHTDLAATVAELPGVEGPRLIRAALLRLFVPTARYDDVLATVGVDIADADAMDGHAVALLRDVVRRPHGGRVRRIRMRPRVRAAATKDDLRLSVAIEIPHEYELCRDRREHAETIP